MRASVGLWRMAALAASVALAVALPARAAEPALRVMGNTTTIELAPVHLAVQRLYGTTIPNGGVPDLFTGKTDVATNAETQALRVSVDNPDLRIILTVSEGFYRIVARRSSGITKLADLKGKRIATWPNTSSAYYLKKVLATVGLTEADVIIVPVMPPDTNMPDKMPAMLASRQVDAVTIWEPEIENAKAAVGADAIEFKPPGIYRELFNLNTTAANLADPVMRRKIVVLVREIIRASADIRRNPELAYPLLTKATGFDSALIAKVWEHEGYPGTLVPDLLDVLAEEDAWVAKERNRPPRSRAQLARLIDESVLKEAQAGR